MFALKLQCLTAKKGYDFRIYGYILCKQWNSNCESDFFPQPKNKTHKKTKSQNRSSSTLLLYFLRVISIKALGLQYFGQQQINNNKDYFCVMNFKKNKEKKCKCKRCSGFLKLGPCLQSYFSQFISNWFEYSPVHSSACFWFDLLLQIWNLNANVPQSLTRHFCH